MKKTLLMIVLFLTSTSIWASSSAVKGCIAKYQGTTPISVEVTLPAFSRGLFATDLFRFTNLPQNMTTDEQGRYCYPMKDERFAFVHMFYYAVNEMDDYKRIFYKLGLSVKKRVSWKLYKGTGPSGGMYVSSGESTFNYPEIPDPSSVQHEIGHWAQSIAAGNDHDVGGPLGEGSANLLAVLHSGNTIIGKYDSYELAYDVNTFVQLPDHILTTFKFLEQVVNGPLFNEKYPELVASTKIFLNSGLIDPDSPNPYTTSSVINQPLWEAAIHFDVDTIKLLFIKTLTMLNENREYGYDEISNVLVKNAYELNPDLGLYLQQEYEIRGALRAYEVKSSDKMLKYRHMRIGIMYVK